MGDKGVLLSAEWERRLRQLWRWKSNVKVTGPGVTYNNSPEALTVVMSPPPAAPTAPTDRPKRILCKVTAAKAGGGWYAGTAYGGIGSPPDATATLSLPAGMSAGNTITILNPEENGLPTHWIAIDTYVECDYAGGVDGDGVALVTVSGPPVYRTASPVTIGSSSPGTSTPDEATWSRLTLTSGSAKGDTPLELWLCGRPVWDTTAKKLLAMMRKLSIDAGGRIVHVGDETLMEVDAAEPPCEE